MPTPQSIQPGRRGFFIFKNGLGSSRQAARTHGMKPTFARCHQARVAALPNFAVPFFLAFALPNFAAFILATFAALAGRPRFIVATISYSLRV